MTSNVSLMSSVISLKNNPWLYFKLASSVINLGTVFHMWDYFIGLTFHIMRVKKVLDM